MRHLDSLPMFVWYPLMKVTFILYFRLGIRAAGKVWRAL